jgi:Zn finger protein HypA/HybF involved in hydrogenase expression
MIQLELPCMGGTERIPLTVEEATKQLIASVVNWSGLIRPSAVNHALSEYQRALARKQANAVQIYGSTSHCPKCNTYWNIPTRRGNCPTCHNDIFGDVSCVASKS